VGFVIKSLYSNDLEFRTLKLCSKCNCELENYKNLDGVLVCFGCKSSSPESRNITFTENFCKILDFDFLEQVKFNQLVAFYRGKFLKSFYNFNVN